VNATGQRGIAEIVAPALCAIVVIAIYGVIACTADSELGSRTAGEAYYNRLIDGFAKGQLSLDLAAPAGLAQLADPYDPTANARFQGGPMYTPGRIHDLSYYHGKLYLYFSVVPALVLFLPIHWLTGAYISHQQACFVFCSLGFLASAALVESIRRRCFSLTGAAAAGFCTLCVGLIPVVPIVLQRPDVWEVAVTASHAFWMLSLLVIWISLDRPARSWPIALCASLAVGLAVGCRPNGFLGAGILFLPLLRAFKSGDGRDGRGRAAVAAALLLPIAAIGAGLMAYNHARFQNVLEFGDNYQLSIGRVAEGLARHFDPGYLGFNIRLYFFEYPGWQRAFPFVKALSISARPEGYGYVEHPVGALTLLPFVLCAACVPLAFRELKDGLRKRLALICGAILLLFAAGAGPLCLYYASCVRYQLEFVPALNLLAAIGFLALASSSRSSPGIRLGIAVASGCAAAVSIAFNLLMAANLRGDVDSQRAAIAVHSGQLDQGAVFYARALRLQPSNVFVQVGLSDIFVQEGRFAEACALLDKTAVLLPNSPVIHANHAYLLLRVGRLDEAAAECAAALRLHPGDPDTMALAEDVRRARQDAH
jgi:tetratricopeptide (TPR) repeat protein